MHVGRKVELELLLLVLRVFGRDWGWWGRSRERGGAGSGCFRGMWMRWEGGGGLYGVGLVLALHIAMSNLDGVISGIVQRF